MKRVRRHGWTVRSNPTSGWRDEQVARGTMVVEGVRARDTALTTERDVRLDHAGLRTPISRLMEGGESNRAGQSGRGVPVRGRHHSPPRRFSNLQTLGFYLTCKLKIRTSNSHVLKYGSSRSRVTFMAFVRLMCGDEKQVHFTFNYI